MCKKLKPIEKFRYSSNFSYCIYDFRTAIGNIMDTGLKLNKEVLYEFSVRELTSDPRAKFRTTHDTQPITGIRKRRGQ